MSDNKICTCLAGPDTYEIIYSPSGVEEIVRYRRGRNGPGVLVNYDELPSFVQLAIYERLRQALKDEEDV